MNTQALRDGQVANPSVPGACCRRNADKCVLEHPARPDPLGIDTISDGSWQQEEPKQSAERLNKTLNEKETYKIAGP